MIPVYKEIPLIRSLLSLDINKQIITVSSP